MVFVLLAGAGVVALPAPAGSCTIGEQKRASTAVDRYPATAGNHADTSITPASGFPDSWPDETAGARAIGRGNASDRPYPARQGKSWSIDPGRRSSTSAYNRQSSCRAPFGTSDAASTDSKTADRGDRNGGLPPPVTTCTTIGVQHENGRSYATVRAEATHLREGDQVIYEIAWDAAVAPIEHPHLHAVANRASDFVVDLGNDGQLIGKSIDHYGKDDERGRYFEYNDGIEQPEKNGGVWRFRLRIVDRNGRERPGPWQVATVDWNH